MRSGRKFCKKWLDGFWIQTITQIPTKTFKLLLFGAFTMFLEICMQIHSVVFAKVDKLTSKKYAKTINLLCAGYKVFVKYQGQGVFLTSPPLAYALALTCRNTTLRENQCMFIKNSSVYITPPMVLPLFHHLFSWMKNACCNCFGVFRWGVRDPLKVIGVIGNGLRPTYDTKVIYTWYFVWSA